MEAILRAAASRGTVPHYVARLLSSFSRRRDETSTVGAEEPDIRAYGPAPSLPFYEPGSERLSVREVEVLRLIAGGKTNAEIAQTLVVAVSTIKSHTNSIFGKLQVSNRREAILRAREMQLL